MEGFTVGYQRGGAIVPGWHGRLELPSSVLREVVIEPEGAPWRDPEREDRVRAATQ
jgi:hypothetical protein